MKKIKILVVSFFLFLGLHAAHAQKQEINQEDYSNNTIEMADAMRSDGKIYVLVAIIVAIFAGFVFYTIRTEQKIKKIEEEINNKA